MARLSAAEVERFNKEGYLLLRNVFTRQEMEGFENTFHQLKEKYFPSYPPSKPFVFKGSLSNYKGFESLPFDDRLLDIAKSILGDSIIYFGDSSAHMGGGLPFQRGLHRDCVNRHNLFGPDWDSSYTIIRLGIYIGDLETNSGGLKIQPRSHQIRFRFLGTFLRSIMKRHIRIFSPPFTWFRSFLAIFEGGRNMPSHSGDVIVWNFRTLHSASDVRLKWHPEWSFPVWIENLLPKSWIQPGGDQKMACLFAYATAGPHLDRYLEIRRPSDLEMWWKHIRWDSVVEQKAREKGVILQKPDPAAGELYQPEPLN